MRKRSILSILLVIFLIFGAVGCQNNIDDDNIDPNVAEEEKEDDTQYRPIAGGTMTVPITYVETLNPLLEDSLSLYYFNKLIFEGLFEFDENLNIKPLLAESYEIMGNGRKIKVKLKEGVQWHDGETLTARDVEFTINTLRYGATQSTYSKMMSKVYKPSDPEDIQHILDVDVIDDYNLEILFDRSYSNALESLIFPIIPEHKFTVTETKRKRQYQLALQRENYQPIGTGPYTFDNYQNLKSIDLKVNPNWWNGKPYIEQITGKILENKQVAITSFESNIVDVAPALGIDWEKYAQNKDINIYEFVSQNYVFLGFNFNNELFQGEKGKALRKAMAYGINREAIINKLYLGHATKVDVPIHPESWLMSEAGSTYDYNVSKAKGILESAGWKDTNGDGIYEDETGQKLSMRILINSYNDLRRETANMIADYLEEIGIEVVKDYQPEIKEEVTEKMAQEQWGQVVEKIYAGNFDVTLLEWELSHIPDLAFAFHSEEIERGSNIIGYENETMDKLITDAFSVHSREEKAKVYKELQKFIVEELPYVSLYFKNSALLVNSKVNGDIKPMPFNIYNNIKDWYVLREPIETEEEE